MKHSFLARFSIGLLFVYLVSASCAGASNQSREGWLILEGNSGGHTEIVSVRSKTPDEATRSRFPTLIKVLWGFRGLPNGLPTEEEIVYARRLYAALDGIVGENGVHAMTKTGGGGRTMYYYVNNTQLIIRDIKNFFDNEPPLSIQVISIEEPDWISIREVLQAVKHDAQPSVPADRLRRPLN